MVGRFGYMELSHVLLVSGLTIDKNPESIDLEGVTVYRMYRASHRHQDRRLGTCGDNTPALNRRYVVPHCSSDKEQCMSI